MSTAREGFGRSLLLTAISYPLFALGLVILFAGPEVAGAVLTACGTFLIATTEVCYSIQKLRAT
ncbi:hypothetical protein BF93_15410 [Brachybacterium phenoliresistens]|uniref:Uncharacterized protein n=1 Tax=Brachybacterium phenoliresistens TaxID=396014 RepID=Z9JU64_9MICO|nr:hypothetical protein [Brachybacterium phenoliresistens]EWS81744.1 hypothetical protein BF93_15410 [Brachybacterium phenoliresistens]